MDTEPLEHDLTSKIGPLPAWAWGAVAIGGYLVYTHFVAAAPSPPATDAPVDDGSSAADVGTLTDDGSFSDGSTAGYSYGDVLSGDYSGTVSPAGYGQYVTNQQWAIAAIQALITAGVPAGTATTAITLYLAGSGSLTSADVQAVNQAISLIGPPPLPLPVNLPGGGSVVGSPTPEGGGEVQTPGAGSGGGIPTTKDIKKLWRTPVGTKIGTGTFAGTTVIAPGVAQPMQTSTKSAAASLGSKFSAAGIPYTTTKPSSGSWQEWLPGVYTKGLSPAQTTKAADLTNQAILGR